MHLMFPIEEIHFDDSLVVVVVVVASWTTNTKAELNDWAILALQNR